MRGSVGSSADSHSSSCRRSEVFAGERERVFGRGWRFLRTRLIRDVEETAIANFRGPLRLAGARRLSLASRRLSGANLQVQKPRTREARIEITRLSDRRGACTVQGMSSIIVPTDLESLTERIIGCGIAVHKELGPGLLESVYRECLCIEFELAGLSFACEKSVPIVYRGRPVSTHLRIDLLVEEKVVVEIKAVEKLHPIYSAQVITYLKLARCPAGLLMNFNATSLRHGLQRRNHPDLHAAGIRLG